MEKIFRVLKSVTSMCTHTSTPECGRRKQGREFPILITCLNANDPNAKAIATNKNSCLTYFGAYSSCTTLRQSFTVGRATSRRHD